MCPGNLVLFQIKICDFSYPTLYIRTELLSLRVQHVSWEPCPISDQDMWFFLPYTVYQNWTAVLESPACVLGTLSYFRSRYVIFPTLHCISELNSCPWESSTCPGNLIPISDQNKWFSLPYIRSEVLTLRVQHVSWEPCPISDQNMWFSLPYTAYQNWTAALEGPACVRGTLSLFLIKICDFPYPILELNCCPQESSTCPGNLIPISDQNMWFSPPYIRTELLSLRVQHVSWEPYPYFRPTYMYTRKYPT